MLSKHLPKETLSLISFTGYEFNRIEFTPIHDAIILNDIVDVLNEFENSMVRYI